EGRGFSRQYGAEEKGIVINETSKKIMGFENPIGKQVTLGENNVYSIIGIVRDFHFVSRHTEIEPLIILLDPDQASSILVRLKSGDPGRTLKDMEGTWAGVAGAYDFDFRFLDESLNALYQSEERVGRIITVFAVLSILVSCLGLFGLASFMVLRRTREIGIRKVLGASVSGVAVLVSREFAFQILAANLITWPIAYLALFQWLKTFPYRTGISIHIFLVTGLITLFLALLTVSYQSIRTALSNPAESLRFE
ncbi:MAG: hypothetical protein MUP70_10000, partial [Candidatus Aminicenantes bacterium]|nr:hypothetical protein [Candidatus Aminicenantes bacterium]